MFLPHNLTSSVRRSKKANKLNGQRTLSEGASSESGIVASTLNNDTAVPAKYTAVKVSKKRGKTPAGTPPAASECSPSLVARGWARLSRRGKRRKRDSSTAIIENHSVPRRDTIDGPSTSQSGTVPQDPCTSVSAETSAECSGAMRVASSTDRKNIVVRGMDKLRRSFRKSFRRSKGQVLTASAAAPSPPSSSTACTVETTACNVHNGKTYCQLDEAAVRSAACSFQVKYLGAVEVFESRGMHICEGALQQLRMKKRQTKAVLYVTGDGIRVVDQESNRGLILDQTIEKVSFCAPDRHNHRGFAYICRDGATKRWMCHGFQSTKESGERLSHAVGCAFTICLEKKRKRDAETAAYRSGQALALITNATTSNFDKAFESAQSSSRRSMPPPSNESGATFRRQLSIAERKLDPQTAIVVSNGIRPDDSPAVSDVADASLPWPASSAVTAATIQTPVPAAGTDLTHSVIKPRPAANPSLFERQGSFKAPNNLSNFKRFNSLRTDIVGASSRLPSVKTLHNDPIYEGDDENLSAELCSLNFVGGNGFSPPSNAFATPTVTQMSTSHTFAGQPNQPADFTAQFVRGDAKRASRADEWLAQILQTSAANGDASQLTAYYNLATQMTPSNSTTSDGGFETAAPHFPHSQSADVLSGGFGATRFGPPPSQPPPPLPPSVVSRLNGVLPHRAALSWTVHDAQSVSTIATASGTIPSSLSTVTASTIPVTVTNGPNSTITINNTTISTFYTRPQDTITKSVIKNDQNDSFGFVRDIVNSSISNSSTSQPNGFDSADTVAALRPPATIKITSTPRNSATASAATRKSSAARLSIEYQLLEETDVPPQSPPRVNSPRPDTTGQCQLNSYGTDDNNTDDAATAIRRAATASERCALTISPTGASSAEMAIQTIRKATRSTLASAESAISALHNSTQSDDPFDVKWSAEVLQHSAAATLRKSSGAPQRIEPLATNNC